MDYENIDELLAELIANGDYLSDISTDYEEEEE
jgi:hypothetical protein